MTGSGSGTTTTATDTGASVSAVITVGAGIGPSIAERFSSHPFVFGSGGGRDHAGLLQHSQRVGVGGIQRLCDHGRGVGVGGLCSSS